MLCAGMRTWGHPTGDRSLGGELIVRLLISLEFHRLFLEVKAREAYPVPVESTEEETVMLVLGSNSPGKAAD